MSAPVQLDLLEVLAFDARRAARTGHSRALMLRYLDGKPETYSDRHHFGCLTPGEACPGCGHLFRAGGADASGDHHMTPGATECEGRISYREHAQHAYTAHIHRAGSWTSFERAVAAAAPCWTAAERTAWLEHPVKNLFATGVLA